ncbi:hypothetical protein E4K67_23375 [Desulfosporosinus fructosivorans]|uniref:Uncharacterized protein n=1 Tax=Desulfosporosinus fructosivorans TaxID=2018669 RepID=A0A4Z0QZ40_9FIRM|nr:hypothetical protein [Desulfosporosinus fructosivorans]TGE35710.1 hypothetical protein E4K67_23375 [Desulfosporosinus fructosivorans]
MSENDKKVLELSDEEIEKAAAGGQVTPIAKQCRNCGCKYDLDVAKCPDCGSYDSALIYSTASPGKDHGGPR